MTLSLLTGANSAPVGGPSYIPNDIAISSVEVPSILINTLIL